MPHFLPWEEGAPQRKQEDQRLLGSWLPVGPRETGLPTSCSGQKEKHVGDFASQAEFLERREVILRDAEVGTVLLELPCSQWKAQQCDKHSERYSWVTREEWWSVTDGKLEWSGLGRNFNSQAHLRLFLSVSLASPFSPAMGPGYLHSATVGGESLKPSFTKEETQAKVLPLSNTLPLP